MVWTKDRIGEHWSSGDFRISTFLEIVGGELSKSGYRLYWRKGVLGEYATLRAAQVVAAWYSEPRGEGTVGTRS